MTDSTKILEKAAEADINTFTNVLQNIVHWLLTSGIRVALIIAIAYFLKLLSKRFVNRITHAASSSDKINMSDGEIKRMSTIARLIKWTINTIIILIAAMLVLKEFKVDIAPILAGAGILGVAVGFGGQYLVRDIITGFFIIFENQYRIGDVLTISGITGAVEDITLRVTSLRDGDGTIHHIPHGEIKTVSNQTVKFSRININIGVAYSAKIDHVKEVIDRTGKALAEDKEWSEMINIAPHFLRVDSFADSSVVVKIIGETKPSKQWDVAGEFRKRIKEAFENEGIDLPYPQQAVHILKS